MRRTAIALLTASLAACATSERRLDAAWERFQIERAAVESHSERVRAAAAEDARRTGDDRRLVLLTMPPESPIARALLASTLASLAYLSADLAALERARSALRQCSSDLTAVERELAARPRGS